MLTLGINAAFHDCSACLVEDGRVVAAAEEERFTRIKHGKRPLPFTVWQLPYHAIDYCLAEAGVMLRDVDHVAYAYDPFIQLGEQACGASVSLPLSPAAAGASWETLALSYVVNAPRQLADGAPHHLLARFAGVQHDGPFQWHFVEHHRAHEASVYLASPFDECAVLVMDGRGERACSSYGIWENGHYLRLKQVDYPHSLGLFYEDVTNHLGFLHASDEYKVMALAAYGRPSYLPRLRELLRYRGGGDYTARARDWREVLGEPRRKGAPLEQKHLDIAHSVQALLEETVADMADWLHFETGAVDLGMAGGVALNCVMNARLRDHGPFSRVWVQPAAGDAGTALGAALLVDREQAGASPARMRWSMDDAYLGPSFSDAEIERLLRESKLAYRRPRDIACETARLLRDNLIVGWFQGRMEFGPRALGARSILASPLDAQMLDRLNQLKDREDFRPVAPVVLEEVAGDWFVGAEHSPFMLFTHAVRSDKAARIPAVRHVDGSARIQTINRGQNPLFYDLLSAFGERTKVPVLINTSFNTRGKPIVCTPQDALEAFCSSGLDALAIGPFLLEKAALMSETR